MERNLTFDVIILGGGPAGLSSAVNLAKRGSDVLVLEKNRLTATKKTWLTFDYILEKYSITECIRNTFSEVILSSYLGNSYEFKNKKCIYPIDEEKALALLADKACANGTIIKDHEAFVHHSFNNKNDRVTITTTKNTYSARLVIDAMGRESNILQSTGFRNKAVDMGCLGYFLQGVNHKNENKMLLYDSYIPGSDYFWLVPLEEDKLMAGIFFFSALNKDTIKEKAEKLKFYLKARNIKGKIYDKKMGNIPLGGQTNVATGNILHFGDSCNIPLPSSGFSFNRCLEESEIVADFCLQYLDKKTSINQYKRAILDSKIPGIEIHLIISDMLSKFTDPMLNKAIGAMNNLDEKFIISFLSGRDMGINFSITALRAILTTFSLSDIRSLSLNQNHLKNLVNLYNLLPSLTSVKFGEQLIDFVKGTIKKNESLKKG